MTPRAQETVRRWLPALSVIVTILLTTGGWGAAFLMKFAVLESKVQAEENRGQRLDMVADRQGETLAAGMAMRIALTKQVDGLAADQMQAHKETMDAFDKLLEKLDRHIEAPKMGMGVGVRTNGG